MKIAVIIVAAGRGHRAGTDIPKQYIPLCGKVVLRRTIEAFLRIPHIDVIQAVIHSDDQEHYDQATEGLSLLAPVEGGDSRQQSVMNGLEALAPSEPELVLIHDAARPFISAIQIENIIQAAAEHGAVIPALPIVDTVKKIDGDKIMVTLDRNSLARAQTPQAFRYKLIYMAHRKMANRIKESHGLSDDSAIAEACGIQIKTIQGDEDNFKITSPKDLEKAEDMIREKLTDIRTGLGYDVHSFEAGDHVMIGGIAIPHNKALMGHSDADVALHALTDALLGAIGDGDIGSHFPPSEKEWKNAGSDIFLKHAHKLLKEKQGMISNIDLTIICEAPKITPHRNKIRENIANILDLTVARVSIKATTTEKLGFTGRGEGIAAQAIVTVRLPE